MTNLDFSGTVLSALVLFALTGSAWSQSGVPVPKSGTYLHSAPAGNKIYERSDAGPTQGGIEVSNCGDVVTLTAPDSPDIDLVFNGAGWAASKIFNGTSVKYFLTASSETNLSLTVNVGGADQPSDLELITAASSQGDAAIRYVGESQVRESLFWVVTERKYILDLYDFEVNESALLPVHEATIQQALDMMFDAQPNPDVQCSSMLEPTVDNNVVGYASQTGPERVNQRLATSRAQAVAAKINDLVSHREGNVFFGLSPNAISGRRRLEDEVVFDAPNLETQCNRRAVWQFTIRERSIDPYLAADALQWLRNDLRRACVSTESDGTTQSVNARAHARAKYVLALNFLDMIAAGHCAPLEAGMGNNDEAAAARMLDEGNPYSSPPDQKPETEAFNGALSRAYEVLERQILADYTNSAYDSGLHRMQELEKMQTNPYYCYANTLNDGASVAASSVEVEVCGSSDADLSSYANPIGAKAEVIPSGICHQYH